MKDALYRRGMRTRRQVLGEARERQIESTEDDFSAPLREFTTRYVWGEFWSSKGLPRKTRSLINVALLAALKCRHELKVHVRGALNNGCTPAEIREVFRQCAIYAGVPVMRDAVTLAQEVFAENAQRPRPRSARARSRRAP
jgi:4-carboxymuconolactone decarboxylase